jgi:hypothetical protein
MMLHEVTTTLAALSRQVGAQTDIPVEALVDMRNGIDNRAEICAILYDGQTIVLLIDGSQLEY